VGYFEKAIVLEPGSADARHNLGIALQELSRHDEAIERFGRSWRSIRSASTTWEACCGASG